MAFNEEIVSHLYLKSDSEKHYGLLAMAEMMFGNNWIIWRIMLLATTSECKVLNMNLLLGGRTFLFRKNVPRTSCSKIFFHPK